MEARDEMVSRYSASSAIAYMSVSQQRKPFVSVIVDGEGYDVSDVSIRTSSLAKC